MDDDLPHHSRRGLSASRDAIGSGSRHSPSPADSPDDFCRGRDGVRQDDSNLAAPVGAVGAILLVGLATESLAAFPDYIPFFNIAAGGSRGGIRLLGDSNLDWGQDLLLLADWHRKHPDVKLYASTFGAIDPRRLGVPYTPMPAGFWGSDGALPPDPNQPGVLVIGASILQGIYVREPWDRMYAEIRTWKPREVLGGSIYLYDFPPPEMSQHP